MRSTGETAPSQLSFVSPLYQVSDSELRQCREPTVQYVVRRLILVGVASDFQLRAMNVRRPSA
jgi:hypothetical protein